MKNLFIISAVILIFAVYGCGSPPSSDPNQPPSNCVTLSGGLVSNITGTWKVDAKATSYSNEVFNFSTDIKGYGNGVCSGMGPCYNGSTNEELRWSVSGNTITLNAGVWYTDAGQQKFWVYTVVATYYWEIKPSTTNTLTLEYNNVGYNNCTAPFNSTRQ